MTNTIARNAVNREPHHSVSKSLSARDTGAYAAAVGMFCELSDSDEPLAELPFLQVDGFSQAQTYGNQVYGSANRQLSESAASRSIRFSYF